jgi:hypothetical protein
MWHGILMLFALGSGPTDQPIKTTGWGQVYDPASYAVAYASIADPAQAAALADAAAKADCEKALQIKVDELNVIYTSSEQITASAIGTTGHWTGACYK